MANEPRVVSSGWLNPKVQWVTNLLVGIPIIVLFVKIVVSSDDPWLTAAALGVPLILGLIIAVQLRGFSYVAFDHEFVYLRGGRQTVKYPLASITKRGYSWFWKQCWLEFEEPTPFGKRVWFYPKEGWGSPGTHPNINAFFQAISDARLQPFREKEQTNSPHTA